jgi:NADPH:quinone reductase-like Zn-dependent oxidoreductase
MKAVVQDRYGSFEVMELEEVAPPPIGAGDVLVRVRAVGVNWADWSGMTGRPYLMRLGYGLRRPRKGIRGTDVAGVVESVGDEVARFRPGDAVFGWCTAALAEYVAAPEHHFVRMPENITFEQAAAVPMAGIVALQALRDVGRVKPGDKVLVNGASGGIGTFTVQIAKSMGAEVTGVCSTPNTDLVRSIGADHVIDYTREDFTKGGETYDFILDMADDHTLAERRRVLTRGGTLVPNSGRGGPWLGSVGRILKARMLSPFVSQRYRPFLSLSKQEDLAVLRDMIESGEITPVLDHVYSLAEAGEAIGHVGEGHAHGKTVVSL